MMTNKHLSNIIIAAALLSTSSGFAPPSSINSSCSASQELRSNIISCQEISSLRSSRSSTKCRPLTISRMAVDDEEVDKTTESSDPSTTAANEASTAPPTAGGGTIALTSAKSAADAATTITTNGSTTNGANNSIKSSPSNTGFSLLLLPTLLFKFTIVLIVKFATDVVVYPTLYLWRWARVGRNKVGRGMARLLGRDSGDVVKVERMNGAALNGDSVGDFQ